MESATEFAAEASAWLHGLEQEYLAALSVGVVTLALLAGLLFFRPRRLRCGGRVIGVENLSGRDTGVENLGGRDTGVENLSGRDTGAENLGGRDTGVENLSGRDTDVEDLGGHNTVDTDVEDLQKFWRALFNAQLNGGFVELPEGVNALGDLALDSSFYVRRCYEQLFDVMIDPKYNTHTAGRPRTERPWSSNWVITGNPGIGKTYFAA